MLYDTDLHFHGKYATGVSKHMIIPTIAEQARLKGLHIVATADILHKDWCAHVKENLIKEGQAYKHKTFDTYFILSTEVQTNDRVHHVILFPDFESVQRLRIALLPFSSDMDKDGRPRLRISPEKLAQEVEKVEAIFGPAHAFTPYFGVLAHYDSLASCYGGYKIHFLELGLSADSNTADMIPELRKIPFLSNSDSHSPWPHRLGREFNRLEIESPIFEEIKLALERKQGRRIALNVGFDPREGKYNCSACHACYQRYSVEQAKQFEWRCRLCNKKIKKGVQDRINELSDGKLAHPEFRPQYIHVIPLAEIIAKTIGAEGLMTAAVQSIWRRFIEQFGSEIRVLIDAPMEELASIDKNVAASIDLFRRDKTIMLRGGGGNYGELIIPKNENHYAALLEQHKAEIEGYFVPKERNLTEFF